MRIAVMDENITEGTKTAALIRDAWVGLRRDDVKIAEYTDCYSFTRAFQETDFDFLFVAIYGIRDFEATWKIRDMDRRIPIAVIFDDGEYASASWRINISDYLVKPLKPDDMRHSVARVLAWQPLKSDNGNAVYDSGIKNVLK